MAGLERLHCCFCCGAEVAVNGNSIVICPQATLNLNDIVTLRALLVD